MRAEVLPNTIIRGICLFKVMALETCHYTLSQRLLCTTYSYLTPLVQQAGAQVTRSVQAKILVNISLGTSGVPEHLMHVSIAVSPYIQGACRIFLASFTGIVCKISTSMYRFACFSVNFMLLCIGLWDLTCYVLVNVCVRACVLVSVLVLVLYVLFYVILCQD